MKPTECRACEKIRQQKEREGGRKESEEKKSKLLCHF